MEKILGNFLTQSNRDFPLDCETLDYLQRLCELQGVIGNIAGDRVVVSGCRSNAKGTHRDPGYLFLRTEGFPDGEIIYWEGGSTSVGMYVKTESVGVSANNVDYPRAYTRRSMAAGIGSENYSWDDFRELSTLVELEEANRELREELAAIAPPPLGVVQLWSGKTVPEGYVLCDGRALSIADYGELYAAIGTAFNGAVSAVGIRYTTSAGEFRVPDLRGRFVVGQHDSDDDYKTKGAGGGKKLVALTEAELPEHSHDVRDYYYPERSAHIGGNVVNNPAAQKYGSKATDTDNDGILYEDHTTGSVGEGASHENRPPYYVLAYIMRVK